MLVQYFNQIVPEIRTQFDIIFILATANKNTINKIHEEHIGASTPRLFHIVLTSMTQNRGTLIIDNRLNASTIEECCFFAPSYTWPLPECRFGEPSQWNFHEAHYLKSSSIGDLPQLRRVQGEGEGGDVDDDTTASVEAEKTLQHRIVVHDPRLGSIVIKKKPTPFHEDRLPPP